MPASRSARDAQLRLAPLELRLRLADRSLAAVELAQLRKTRLELRLAACDLALGLRQRGLLLGERRGLLLELRGLFCPCSLCLLQLLRLDLELPLPLRRPAVGIAERRLLGRDRLAESFRLRKLLGSGALTCRNARLGRRELRHALVELLGALHRLLLDLDRVLLRGERRAQLLLTGARRLELGLELGDALRLQASRRRWPR